MPIRVWCFSDLHRDIGGQKKATAHRLPDPHPEHDLVLIAGDTCERFERGVKWAASAGFDKPVVMIGGNHEGYNTSRDGTLRKARAEAAKHENIHVLQDDWIDFDIRGERVRIYGATLWTDYALNGEAERPRAMSLARDFMNDHARIRLETGGYRKFRPLDALKEHESTVTWLKWALDEPFDGARIVMTHHAPSIKSSDPRWPRDGLSVAYMSHLDDLVSRVDLWVHGHIHCASDYTIGDARVICNPRGYSGSEGTGWDPNLVVEVSRTERTDDDRRSAFETMEVTC